jgi:hypothetical protein
MVFIWWSGLFNFVSGWRPTQQLSIFIKHGWGVAGEQAADVDTRVTSLSRLSIALLANEGQFLQ